MTVETWGHMLAGLDNLSNQMGKVDSLEIHWFYWCHNVSNWGELHIPMHDHILKTFLYPVFTFVLP